MTAKREVDSLYEELCQDKEKVAKYKHPGIYSISIEDKLVYIGKSADMLYRLAQHMCEIESGKRSKTNKYRVLNEALNRQCAIGFDVMFVSQQTEEQMFQEIGREEAKLINQYMPPLNYQIPNINDYKHFTVNRKAKNICLDEILDPTAQVFNF